MRLKLPAHIDKRIAVIVGILTIVGIICNAGVGYASSNAASAVRHAETQDKLADHAKRLDSVELQERSDHDILIRLDTNVQILMKLMKGLRPE